VHYFSIYSMAPTSIRLINGKDWHNIQRNLSIKSESFKEIDVSTNHAFNCWTRFVASTKNSGLKKLATCLDKAWNSLHLIPRCSGLNHKITTVIIPKFIKQLIQNQELDNRHTSYWKCH